MGPTLRAFAAATDLHAAIAIASAATAIAAAPIASAAATAITAALTTQPAATPAAAGPATAAPSAASLGGALGQRLLPADQLDGQAGLGRANRLPAHTRGVPRPLLPPDGVHVLLLLEPGCD